MDDTKLFFCVIFLNICCFSKQNEDLRKEWNPVTFIDDERDDLHELIEESSGSGTREDIHEYSPCPSQTDDRNTKWPQTFPGLTVRRNCKFGYVGLASRECRMYGYNGTWMEPSYINCVRENIAEVQNKLEDRIIDGVEVKKLVNVIRQFKNVSRGITQTEFSASDVRSCLLVIDKLSDILTNQKDQITEEEAVEFFEAVDIILSGTNKDSWQDLFDKTGENGAATVMNIVDYVSVTVSKTLPVDQSISVVGENIVVQIENMNIGSILFPKNKLTGVKSAVFFSIETIRNSLNVTDKVRYSAVYYKTIGNLLPKRQITEEIGSPILSFSIPDGDILKKLDPPVQLSFETKETNFTGRLCSYWNPYKGEWAADGCRASFVNETFTECKCNHLTNFAVLMSVKEIIKEHNEIMSTMSLVGFIISIVCLMLTIFIYIYQWRHIQSDKSVILLLLCITLIVAYFTYIFGVERTANTYVCTGVAVSLHYLFLVVLCLMASEGIIHVVLVVAVFKQKQSMNRFLIPISFGIPLLIVVISGSITRLNGYGTDKFCWLATDKGLIYSFFGPCAAVVFLNTVITIVLLKKLFSTRATMNKTKTEKIKTGIRSLLILAPMFGLTWLFGLLSFHEDTVVFAYLFVVCNSLQGALIFLMHTLMNPTVKKEFIKSFRRYRNKKDLATSTTSESFQTFNIFKKLRKNGSKDTSASTNDIELVSPACNKSIEVTQTLKRAVL